MKDAENSSVLLGRKFPSRDPQIRYLYIENFQSSYLKKIKNFEIYGHLDFTPSRARAVSLSKQLASKFSRKKNWPEKAIKLILISSTTIKFFRPRAYLANFQVWPNWRNTEICTFFTPDCRKINLIFLLYFSKQNCLLKKSEIYWPPV